MHDELLAPYLAIDIRHAHGQIQGLPIAHWTADTLDTVSIAEAAHGGDVEVRQLDADGSVEERQEVFPVLLVRVPPYVLARRHDIEDHGESRWARTLT